MTIKTAVDDLNVGIEANLAHRLLTVRSGERRTPSASPIERPVEKCLVLTAVKFGGCGTSREAAAAKTIDAIQGPSWLQHDVL
jgi:hypothetical protein